MYGDYIMSCLVPGYNPNPTRTWSRVQSNCSLTIPINPITPLQAAALQMRRKGNALQYKANSSNLTKQQQYSLIAQGKWTNRTKTWATQGSSSSINVIPAMSTSSDYTNPNTHNLQQVGNTLICSSPAIKCVPTSSSDVPGPIIDLCYNDSLPTFYSRENTVMNTSTNVFPKGAKNLQSANAIPSL